MEITVNQTFYKKALNPSAIKKIMTSNAFISFGGGWGDHLPPTEITEAFKYILSNAQEFYLATRYSDIKGSKEFRSTIATYERKIYQRKNINENNIIIGQGSTELTGALFKALLEENDKVLLFDPSYANFKTQLRIENKSVEIISIPIIKINGGIENIVKKEKNEFINRYENIMKKHKIKFCIICSPDNPTSMIWEDDVLREMILIALKHNTWFIIDSSYSNFYFSETMPESFKFSPIDYPNLIIINSFSKNFSLLGFRLGYIIARSEIIELLEYIESARNLSPNVLIQNALNIFLQKTDIQKIIGYNSIIRNTYKEISKKMIEIFLSYLPNSKILKPDGGFYFVVMLDEYNIFDSVKFCKDLLEEEGVLIVPGVDFGNTLQYAFRFTFAPLIRNIEKIEIGIEKIAKFIKNQGEKINDKYRRF